MLDNCPCEVFYVLYILNMVFQKRLDYGFIGYQVPKMPRASRSARGKRSFKRKVEDEHMCAFELLAAVAGKLLQEGESSPASSNVCAVREQPTIIKDNVKKEIDDEEKPHKVQICDQGSCDESVFISDPSSQGHTGNHTPKKFPHSQKNVSLGLASPRPVKVRSFEESSCGKSKNDVVNCTSKVERGSPCHGTSYKGKTDEGFDRQMGFGTQKTGSMSSGSVPDVCNMEELMELDIKPPTLVSSDSSVEVPPCKDSIACVPFPRSPNDTKVAPRDDDENSSGCTRPGNMNVKTFKAQPRIGDRRVRKLLGSRYWKVAPKLKDGDVFNCDGDMKHAFRNKKICYTRQRSQRNFPFKRRKQFQQCSISTSYQGISSSDGISSSPKKVTEGNTIALASGESSSVVGQESSLQSSDSHVKLSIKSFKIPELFIEIPETATVGSLKRTVMEAVTAILGGGLRVGVLVQGKKIRDDNRTLLQTGIGHDNKLEDLGFALEPHCTNAPQAVSTEDPPFLLPCDTPQLLTRYPTTPAPEPGASELSLTLPTTNLGNCIESDHDSVPTPTDMSTDKITPDSKAIVPVPAASAEAFALVPLNRRCRRSELVQRRIRRPFSVSEVEALVQAVEKLGTGRWRDVKLRAFDNAKHRTYVDLKDKWKTLVHTARISPQQRRGEPVPQELLDRVLAAHAYWSQQQARQQQVKQYSNNPQHPFDEVAA